jgi:hypothetical protein
LVYSELVQGYKELVKDNMSSLKVYKPEFDTLIDVYSGMLAQYKIITERLIDSEFNIEVETQRGGTRKSATATAQEKLRTDLITYSDRLQLNPKAFQKSSVETPKAESILSKFLTEIEGR